VSARDAWPNDQPANRYTECHRDVDEFTAIAERWGYWSDACGEILPFCPECARREFANDAPLTGKRISSALRNRRPLALGR
jgi:hypothetical protein